LNIRAFDGLGWVHEPNQQRDALETRLSERMAIANFKTFESDGHSPTAENAYAEIAKSVPIHRAGRAEEMAPAVLLLCSSAASYVVGHALTVDGGMTVM
jgi:NAD(P)-dependent dehydrogenase (short-subunit alcohol dehydrogenase family)